MAEEKKSFILYCDIIHTINKLSDDQAGKLFKHILKYVNDLNPEAEDIVTEIAFEPIKQALKRDLLKYEKEKEKLSEAGKKGAEIRWGNKTKNNTPIPSNRVVKNEIASMPVSVSDSVSLSNNSDKNGGWGKVIGLFPPTKQNGIVEAAIIWNNLEQKEKQKVMRHLNPYVKNTDEKFMKQIGNYFNERMWENMKSKPSTKIKMLDYNFIEWVKYEFKFERFDEARTFLASIQIEEPETFKDIEEEYKQLKINNND